jgi:hypothetical protein
VYGVVLLGRSGFINDNLNAGPITVRRGDTYKQLKRISGDKKEDKEIRSKSEILLSRVDPC